MIHSLKFIVLITLASLGDAVPTNTKSTGRLLYIMFDGFRYDYVDIQSPSVLPGFTRFLSDGVRAQYVNPLSPSLSYPTWTTLSTGLYAENHNIIGNYFLDPSDNTNFSLFDEQATGMKKWWTEEPLWTTATKAGLRAALYLWSRCDIPYDNVVPDTCEKFVKIPGADIFRTNVDKALEKFKAGYDLVQVYTEHTDNTGHGKGPESEDVKLAVRELDEILVYLQDQLELNDLQDVNVVIVSDHGMATTSPGVVTRVEIDEYLPQDGVRGIADKGAFIVLDVVEGYVDEVYESVSKMPGVTVYKKEDIPEEMHVKEATYMHQILIVADLGTFVLASRRPEMLPQRDDSYTYHGAHGYSPEEMKMKAIFFAKGPAFKSGVTIDPINIVDVYQVAMHCLNVPANPNNGTWEHVQDALVNPVSPFTGAGNSLIGHLFAVVLGLLTAAFLR